MNKYRIEEEYGNENPFDFMVEFNGPVDSIYENGVWMIHVILPE